MDSVSGLASDFGHGIALDFGLDHMQLVNCWDVSHYKANTTELIRRRKRILEGINKLKSKF